MAALRNFIVRQNGDTWLTVIRDAGLALLDIAATRGGDPVGYLRAMAKAFTKMERPGDAEAFLRRLAREPGRAAEALHQIAELYLKQDPARAGQSATFRLRTGASARDISGKFEVIRRSPDTHFSFPITSADLLGLGQLDIVSIVSDKGEVEWSLVKDASAPVQAKHIGSLKDFETAARDFLVYCNPK